MGVTFTPVGSNTFASPLSARINDETGKIGGSDSGSRYFFITVTVPANQPNEYMVSYNANGGSGAMVGDMVAENGTFTLENCTYTAPEGYQFKAWAIGGVNGPQKQPGEQITITAETYIYAVWEKVVTFGWEGNVCTVTLETADAENFILAAGYQGGKLVGCAFLDTIQPSASFTCDQVRVFRVGKTSYGPACDPIPSAKP